MDLKYITDEYDKNTSKDTRNPEAMKEATTGILTMNTYQEQAVGTAIYGAGDAIVYPVLGLVNEAGEVAGKIKKVLRDNNGNFDTPGVREAIIDELGDVQWYLAATARDLGVTLEEVGKRNLAKLADRKARNVIQGSGDNR